MATRTTVSVDGDGVQTILMEQIEASDKPKGGDGASLGVEEAPRLSRAQQRLQRLKAASGVEEIRRVDVPGEEEPYWVKRGSFPDLILCAKLAGRDASGALDLSNTENLAGFVAAVLRTFVVCGERDRAPFFESLSDAREFVDSGSAGDSASFVFYATADLNPECWPEGVVEAKNIYATLVRLQQLEKQSSMLLQDRPESLLSEPVSTEQP